MIDSNIRKVLDGIFSGSKAKKIAIGELFKAAKEEALSQDSDMAVEKKLLRILKELAEEKKIKLPSENGKGWDYKTGLPFKITVINTEKDALKKANKEEIKEIRNHTSWEPNIMIPIIHSQVALKTVDDYRKAMAVNKYLIEKPADQLTIPVRERALRIFGDEKALDSCVKTGLFSGRISLKDLDCFYCPEPLPFYPLSMDKTKTKGKPLLLVENANTYQSCRQANEKSNTFAAVIYGKGFKATNTAQVVEGLPEIEERLGSSGIWYFGDLDPAGLDIPRKINASRREADLSLLKPGRPLYRDLIGKGYRVPYQKSQKSYHDRKWAVQWLGEELAALYLGEVESYRWPQEGLSERDLFQAFMEISQDPLGGERTLANPI